MEPGMNQRQHWILRHIARGLWSCVTVALNRVRRSICRPSRHGDIDAASLLPRNFYLISTSGINNSGEVTGSYHIGPGGGSTTFRSSPNDAPVALVSLGTMCPAILGLSRDAAFGINDSGQVVGYSASADCKSTHGFRTAPNS